MERKGSIIHIVREKLTVNLTVTRICQPKYRVEKQQTITLQKGLEKKPQCFLEKTAMLFKKNITVFGKEAIRAYKYPSLDGGSSGSITVGMLILS